MIVENSNISTIKTSKDVEQVQSFTYLGQLITDDGKSEGEIRSRIGLAKNEFSNI